MALAEVLDLRTTAGLPLCPECSDPIEPGDPHKECWPAAVRGATMARPTPTPRSTT